MRSAAASLLNKSDSRRPAGLQKGPGRERDGYSGQQHSHRAALDHQNFVARRTPCHPSEIGCRRKLGASFQSGHPGPLNGINQQIDAAIGRG